MTVAIDFELHQVVVDVDSLVTMRSSYYDDNQKWEELVLVGVTKDNCIEKLTKTFDQTDMSVGNFSFAESVFSNPIDDLMDYQVWKDGIRHFPFSGKYFRLGIKKQEQKKASESVKGALGEIIGGLFFNTKATTLVRSIQRYPDLIGKLSPGRGWAFLEAKCYEKVTSPIFNKRVPGTQFKEVCLKAIEDIKNDKSLLFYASFTKIDSYSPLEISQTIVEISDKNRLTELKKRIIPIPKAYMDQVVEACVAEVIYELSEELTKQEIRKMEGEFLEKEIYTRAKSKLKEIEKSSHLDDGELSKDKDCNKTIHRKTKNIKTGNNKSSMLKDLKSGNSIDFITLPNNPLPKKIQKGKELNEQAIYTQLIDESDYPKIGSIKSKDWELKCLKRGKERVYLIGNSYVIVGDKDNEPQIIDKLEPNDWKTI